MIESRAARVAAVILALYGAKEAADMAGLMLPPVTSIPKELTGESLLARETLTEIFKFSRRCSVETRPRTIGDGYIHTFREADENSLTQITVESKRLQDVNASGERVYLFETVTTGENAAYRRVKVFVNSITGEVSWISGSIVPMEMAAHDSQSFQNSLIPPPDIAAHLHDKPRRNPQHQDTVNTFLKRRLSFFSTYGKESGGKAFEVSATAPVLPTGFSAEPSGILVAPSGITYAKLAIEELDHKVAQRERRLDDGSQP